MAERNLVHVPKGFKGQEMSRRPKGVTPPLPRITMARYFDAEWTKVQAKCPELADTKALIYLGAAAKYLDAHFFGPKATTPRTPAQVKGLIDSFMADVIANRNRPRPGQAAFMRWTGSWQYERYFR